MLGSPDATPYDVRFRLLDVPVRVHPLFWVAMAVISGSRDLGPALTFVAAAFVSILVHEFGHALSSRVLGREPGGIVLYLMGGFCYYDHQHESTWKRLVVLFSGPGAGFLLLGVVLIFASIRFGIEPNDGLALTGLWPFGSPLKAMVLLPEVAISRFLVDLIFINYVWGLFNLLPIWPLDGGQMTTTLLGAVNPRHGTRWGHVISLLVAGGFAVWLAMKQEWFPAFWIGSFAFLNYQVLQSMQASYQWGEEHRFRG